MAFVEPSAKTLGPLPRLQKGSSQNYRPILVPLIIGCRNIRYNPKGPILWRPTQTYGCIYIYIITIFLLFCDNICTKVILYDHNYYRTTILLLYYYTLLYDINPMGCCFRGTAPGEDLGFDGQPQKMRLKLGCCKGT